MRHSVCILRRACIPLFTVLAGLLLSGCGVNNILVGPSNQWAEMALL